MLLMELVAISSMTVRRALYRTEPYYLGELTDLHSSIRRIFPSNEIFRFCFKTLKLITA